MNIKVAIEFIQSEEEEGREVRKAKLHLTPDLINSHPKQNLKEDKIESKSKVEEKIPIAIAIYATYYIFLGFSRTLVEQQVWPHLWFGPIIFLFVLLIFLRLKRIREN